MYSIKDKITKYTNLAENDSLSSFNNHAAQQHHNVYQVFYDFIKKEKPKRIIEIGTSMGGFINFVKEVTKELSLDTYVRSYDINEFPWYKDFRDNGVDIRVENVFNSDYSTVKKELTDLVQEKGKTIILCDGGYKIGEFNILSKYLKSGDIIMAHDYAPNKEYFNKHVNGKIWNWLEIQDSDIQKAVTENNLESHNHEEFVKVAWVCKRKK
jgi:hypothetical protein